MAAPRAAGWRWRKLTGTRILLVYGGDPFRRALAATSLARNHDPAAARGAMGVNVAPNDNGLLDGDAADAFLALPHYWIGAEAGDWSAALADARAADAWLAKTKASRPVMGLVQQVWIHPLEALAQARAGDVAGAASLIETTPLDCYLCLRLRGQIAALAGDGRARRTLVRGGRRARRHPCPSPTPIGARCCWRRATPTARSRSSTLANAKGPHFADPLEMWGEALMAKNHSDLALAKFAEAEKYAPNWGRLHLKWGEALVYAGKTDEAQGAIRPRRRALTSRLPKNPNCARARPWLRESPEAAGEARAGVDPAAMALGLGAASREKADAFLDDQRRMLHLQMEEMRGEYHYKLSHMRLRRFSGWTKAAFEASLGLLALAVVAGLGLMGGAPPMPMALSSRASRCRPIWRRAASMARWWQASCSTRSVSRRPSSTPSSRTRQRLPQLIQRHQGGNTRDRHIAGRGLPLPARMAGTRDHGRRRGRAHAGRSGGDGPYCRRDGLPMPGRTADWAA